MANKFFDELNNNKDKIALARNYEEILLNTKQNKISAMLSIEEGGALNGSIENLYKVYEKGVRLITLTWNYENELGYSHSQKGCKINKLKPFGLEVVQHMNELGMLIDVSHLNDGGFYNIAEISKKPFIASHSNARSIKNVSRNQPGPNPLPGYRNSSRTSFLVGCS
jgi:membrane dipeptidase